MKKPVSKKPVAKKPVTKKTTTTKKPVSKKPVSKPLAKTRKTVKSTKNQTISKKREKMRESLRKRLAESKRKADKVGGKYFIEDLPNNIKFWNPKTGEHTFDIIPYFVGKNDPYLEEGDLSYVFQVPVHVNVGADQSQYVCPKFYKKPCPICEHQTELIQEGATKEEFKVFYPKDRCLYNIVVLDSDKDEAVGTQVWEVSQFLTESQFTKLASAATRKGKKRIDPNIPYADPENGKTIYFEKEGEKQSTRFVGVTFLDRDYEITDEQIEKAYKLDELVKLANYDEIYESFYGEKQEETETKKKKVSKKKRTKKIKKETHDEEQQDEEEENYEEEGELVEEGEEDRPDFEEMSKVALKNYIKKNKIKFDGKLSELDEDDLCFIAQEWYEENN